MWVLDVWVTRTFWVFGGGAALTGGPARPRHAVEGPRTAAPSLDVVSDGRPTPATVTEPPKKGQDLASVIVNLSRVDKASKCHY
jgi:hypothetical protein